MSRQIPYDPTRKALYLPCEDAVFFTDWTSDSEAAVCVEMSRLAYCDASTIEDQLATVDFTLVTAPFDRGGTFGFLARSESDDLTVLAYRGTQLEDPTDMIDDSLFLPAPWGEGGKVHLGFANALDRVWQSVGEALQQSSGRMLFTGHSLGAALATLSASRHPPAALHTFGSPRVGDPDFAAATSSRTEVLRFVNCCDLVTQVPPRPYKHTGRLFYIDGHGQVLEEPPAAEIEADRSLARLEYFHEYAWRFGNVLIRDLADHAAINYVTAVRNL